MIQRKGISHAQHVYMRNTSRFPLITVVALFGACVADEDDPELAVDFHTATLQQPTQIVEEVGQEAFRLFQELAARLEERGVTPEEMQAAVDAGDAERVRELFGYTREEYDEANARLLAIAEQASAASSGVAPPGEPGPPMRQEGWTCNNKALALCTIAAAERAVRYPNSALLVFVFGEALCAWGFCEWDRTDPGPPVRRK